MDGPALLMETVQEYLLEIWGVFSSNNIWQLLVAFIGGGYVTTWMNEHWQKKRDAKALVRANTANIVHGYQRYTRLLRQEPDKRSTQELDFLHADFLAEIRILQFDARFKNEAEQMRILAQKMVNIRQGQSPPNTEKKKLNEIGRDFDIVLRNILAKT